MRTDHDARRRSARMGLLLLLVGVCVLVGLAIFAVVQALSGATTPPRSSPQAPGSARPAPAPRTSGWDRAAEVALASRPMPQLPDSAAQPGPMTTASAGPPLALPAPTQTVGQPVPRGFPHTPEGALAQLAAADQAALTGVDPEVISHTVRAISAPGAPDPHTGSLARNAADLRNTASLPATGPAAQFGATWQPTHGLIKGVTDGGRFATVCVLGPLSVQYQGTSRAIAVADCQAMQWDGATWQIAPIPAAAPAPNAWPGGAAAANVGYRELHGMG